MKRRDLIAAALAAAVSLPCAAGDAPSALAMLEAFGRDVVSAQGRFEQRIYNAEGKQQDETSRGEFRFQRPGKFAWIVTKPYPQQIVSNGVTLWLYDPDLMQVTVKRLGQFVSATPATILFGHKEVGESFVLSDLPKEDGLYWVGAVPKAEDMSFARMSVGFDKKGRLRQMKLFDHFGQTTVLTFEKLEINVDIAPSAFELEIPKGVDVLQDTSTVY